MEQIQVQTVREAIKSPSPAIGFFFQDSPVKTKAILTLLIADLVKWFNVGKTMNDFQIGQTINLILDDDKIKCFKPEDFKLCFERMKKGFYGKSYDRIDGQIIFEALYQYLEERQAEAEQISIDRHKELSKIEKGEVNPEGLKKLAEVMRKAIGEVEKSEPAKEVKKEPKKIEKSERDIFIQNCFAEFNKLSHNQRFLNMGDKHVDQLEYTEIKLKEYDLSLLTQGKDLKDLLTK